MYVQVVKRIAQVVLQELNINRQLNLNLVLPDIIINKTLQESALSDKYYFQLYGSNRFAFTPCLGLSGSYIFVFHFYF